MGQHDGGRPTSAAIIGGGVAGLQAARALLARANFAQVTVFERHDEVGGVWRRNYAGYGAQVTRTQYHMPELDPAELDWYPEGRQLARQARQFAAQFLSGERCSLLKNTEVTALRQTADGRWRVSYIAHTSPPGKQAPTTSIYDVVIMATGLFSRPRVPISKESRRHGPPIAVHSSDLVDLEILRGLRVVIVGMGKSACDLAMAAAQVAQSVDAVARNPTWLLPRRFLGIPVRFLSSTRWFAALTLGQRQGPKAQALQTFLWRWILEPLVRWHFGRVPAAWRPTDDGLREQLWHGRSLAIVDAPSLQDALTAPHVRCIRAEPSRLSPDGLIVRSAGSGLGTAPHASVGESLLEADAVIWATGYDSDAAGPSILDDATLSQLRRPGSEELALYEYVLPVSDELRGLAFIGRVLSTSDVTVSFVQAESLQSLSLHAIHHHED